MYIISFFFIRGNPTSRKTHFVDSGERVKLRLSYALTRGTHPNLNSRPAVQISSSLLLHYAPCELHVHNPNTVNVNPIFCFHVALKSVYL